MVWHENSTKTDKMKEILIAVIVVFSLLGCADSGVKIIDYYYVYAYDSQLKAENVLMCKLSCEDDPIITNVVSVEWNENMLIAETIRGYYIIESGRDELCCCCQDTLIGPMDIDDIEQFKELQGFKPKHKKKFE